MVSRPPENVFPLRRDAAEDIVCVPELSWALHNETQVSYLLASGPELESSRIILSCCNWFLPTKDRAISLCIPASLSPPSDLLSL